MSDDLIKRSDAIAEIYKVRTPDVVSHHYAELFINAVCRAPSVDRPRGEWIEIGDISHSYKCSVCGRTLFHTTVGKSHVAKIYPYCHCGADMRGEHNE